MQKISESSSARLARFEAYAKDQTQINSNKAAKALSDKISFIKTITLEIKPFESVITQTNENILNLASKTSKLEKDFAEIKETILNGDIERITESINNFDSSIYTEITEYVDFLQSELSKIIDDSALETIFLAKQNTVRELNSKKSY